MNKSRLISKVLSGQASASEKLQLQQWIDISPANKAEFDDIKFLYDNITNEEEGEQEIDPELSNGFDLLKAKIQIRRKRERTKKIAVVAGLLVLVLLICYAISYLIGTQFAESITW